MQTKRYNNYRFILLFGVVVVAIFTYIPGISANDISIYSQRAQLIELATENGTFNNEGKLIALENNDAQKQFESSFEYLSSNNDTTWLFENIGYATLKDITNSTSLKSTLNKPSGYKYFETTKQTINTNGYSKIILRPNANRNDNHSSFNIQVPNESAMLINQETLDEIYHKTTEHSNSNPDIEELHFIQNDTIIYIKRIDYKEGTITDLDIEALLIP